MAGNLLHISNNVLELMDNIRGEDFDIRYRSSDPFAFFGNGELEWERDEGSNLAYYLK